MQCRTHPSITGVNTCNECGEWLCDDCTVEINGRIFCRKCLTKLANEPSVPYETAGPSTARPKSISGGLLFIFSFFIPVPGVNYMYLGLIKRGLAAMLGFFLLIYLLVVFNTWPFSLIFGLALPAYWITCVFDGFNIRRRINAGEVVKDDVEDILAFVKRNKNLIIGFIGLVLVLTVVGSILSLIPRLLGRWVPIIVVGLGLYVLFQRPKKRK